MRQKNRLPFEVGLSFQLTQTGGNNRTGFEAGKQGASPIFAEGEV
jgi:hypothetical protein